VARSTNCFWNMLKRRSWRSGQFSQKGTSGPEQLPKQEFMRRKMPREISSSSLQRIPVKILVKPNKNPTLVLRAGMNLKRPFSLADGLEEQ
jgi:hypothetical protein